RIRGRDMLDFRAFAHKQCICIHRADAVARSRHANRFTGERPAGAPCRWPLLQRREERENLQRKENPTASSGRSTAHEAEHIDGQREERLHGRREWLETDARDGVASRSHMDGGRNSPGRAAGRRPDRAARPPDLAQTTTSHGLTVDYIVAVERGTINRFIYGIAMLAPFDYTPHSPYLPTPWNRRLIFSFGSGGGGVGYRQYPMNVSEVLIDEFLSKGYAVAYTTGARTARSYNMTLAEETIMMVKNHFRVRYGEPLYTVGIGSSGGALTQYVVSQNHPGLLDALIPIRGYPDMITQSIYVGDCELMEYYFDHSDNPRWQSKEEREVFEG